jgi:hypothetical protein
MAANREELKRLMTEAFKDSNDVQSWDREQAFLELENIQPDQDVTDLDIQVPNDVLQNSASSLSDVGFDVESAPTQKPSRPRALAIAYNSNTKVVYIVFRDNTWWQYNDVGTDIWMGLSSSSSTNDYLPVLENACSSHGPAQLIDMSAAAMAQLSGISQVASRLQRS